ncbi:hypothetical protein KZ341_10440, partial [Glaesserella parasuis]|nr:hypothetical protein [Glaesserella parasuis]
MKQLVSMQDFRELLVEFIFHSVLSRFSLIDFIERDPTTAEAQRALNQLREEVLALGPVFSDSDYFL